MEGFDFKRTVREFKNFVLNYTEQEQLVREATCNDEKEEIQEALMREIAKGTFTVEFKGIMAIIWKRIKDTRIWQHPFKCLILLEFLLLEGNADMILQQVYQKGNFEAITALTSYTAREEQHICQEIQGTQGNSNKVRSQAQKFLLFLRESQEVQPDAPAEDD
mmetsp:Transcript_24691/g.40942  ORF Transcript_24691/g.40942 Transcript_24691/m.40942 type:complete len:163 (-) Transcript_24691:391-879(-)